MKKRLSVFLVLLLLSSCASTSKNGEQFFYQVTPDYGFHLYTTSECYGETIAFIPAGLAVYTKHPGKKKRLYITYGSVSGYARHVKYKKAINTGYRYLPEEMIAEQNELLFQYNSERTYNTNSSTGPPSSGGTVNVKGYYRKNGTYVKPHTRNAPSRKH